MQVMGRVMMVDRAGELVVEMCINLRLYFRWVEVKDFCLHRCRDYADVRVFWNRIRSFGRF